MASESIRIASAAAALRQGVNMGHGVALRQEDRGLTWPELALHIDRLDSALSAAGLGEDAVIAIPGRNTVAAAAACVATIATRRCAAIVNPFQPAAKALDAARDCGAAALMIDESDLDSCAFEASDTVFVITDDGAVHRYQKGVFQPALSPPGTRLILSTSGTTGEPKRIPISDVTLGRAFDEIGLLNRGFGDRPGIDGHWPGLIQYAPLAHIGGALTLLRGVSQGRCVAMLDKFDPWPWAELVAELRPATTGLPPAMMRMVLDSKIASSALSGLVSVWSGSAPVKAEESAAFTQRFGLPVLGNYGATEYCGAVAAWSLDDHRAHHAAKPGATGRILPSIAKARIRGIEDGALLAPGAIGMLELQVHRIGPDWMTTTDLAHLDADGFLYLQGRIDDVIVRGGFKLRPETIAAALRLHPAVRDAAVVGIFDERLGQVPVAAVERAADEAPIDTAQLIAFVKANLPAYFAPVAVREVSALPRTPAMKVDRRAVRALFEEPAPAGLTTSADLPKVRPYLRTTAPSEREP
jgi:acyl-CoA synthetase (AMP-forming)/AMP-acid ligase II